MSGPYREPGSPVDHSPAEPCETRAASCEDGNKKRAATLQQVLDMIEFRGYANPVTLRASAEPMRGVIQVHLALGNEVKRVFYLTDIEIASNDKAHILEMLLQRIRRTLQGMAIEELERHATLRGGHIWGAGLGRRG